MDEITSSGHVECSACGHVIEGHDTDGCQVIDGCPCVEPWTRREIVEVRRLNGLPARWDRVAD